MRIKKQRECKSKHSHRDWKWKQQVLSLISSILLQTADLIVENPSCTKQAEIKVLFDQGPKRTYVTKRIKDILRLNEIKQEKIPINRQTSGP